MGDGSEFIYNESYKHRINYFEHLLNFVDKPTSVSGFPASVLVISHYRGE